MSKGISKFHRLGSELQEKTEECNLKKIKTLEEVRSLLNAPHDPVRIVPQVRLT